MMDRETSDLGNLNLTDSPGVTEATEQYLVVLFGLTIEEAKYVLYG